MAFLLGLDEISLFLGLFAIVLTMISGFFSPYFGKTSLIIDMKKLHKINLVVSILFFATILIRVANVILLP
jgi:hypothetical protein